MYFVRRATVQELIYCDPKHHRSDDQAGDAETSAIPQSAEPEFHGNSPRIRFASCTRLTPRLSAARRIGIFCRRLMLRICVNAVSKIRKSLSVISVSPQKKL